MLSRRTVLATGCAVLAGCANAQPQEAYLLELLEQKVGGRLGVFMLDTDTGLAQTHRGKEPFGMCSTFKLPLAGVVLREADAGRLDLEERIAFTQADMVPHAPVTSQHLAQGWMTVEALAETAQKTSDNVAANLLIKRLGGPEGVTAKVREIYAHGFRLDRYETQMNFVPPGEVRDTATPEGMGLIVSNLIAPEEGSTRGLTPASRGTLIQWMHDTRTGLKRIRAGLPREWPAGDKTGTADATGMPNKVNDVAAIWPTFTGGPVIVVAFYEAPGEFEGTRNQDQEVLAEVGKLAAIWIRRQKGSDLRVKYI
ncbi:MAG: class A beta-lactamase [Hyphomonadaceae bacterium]|nr:MAG: beta-lactamase [Caulobacteraceae bacterium]MBT9444340.1 class A beta-lactamase [Hyphomonadaceae bacterium]TPW06080.1 MAG: beta-lactamase [Alphaproteobacteria bacterium]